MSRNKPIDPSTPNGLRGEPESWEFQRESGYSAHECVLAIVGSVSLADNFIALNAISDAFNRHDPRRFVSGGAQGIDTMAEKEADRLICQKTIYRPEEPRWNAPRGFKWRNTLIAQDCEHLVRISDCQSKTYGSGWTARKAERMGKMVEEVVVCTCGRGCRPRTLSMVGAEPA